jgi:hypothetical protein
MDFRDYGLLVPRQKVHLRQVEGSPFAVVRTEEETRLVGLASGKRSALIRQEDLIKVKGCNVEHALEQEVYYRTRGPDDDPWGGQLHSHVLLEQENTNTMKEVLEARGFHSVIEPLEVEKYGVRFDGNGPNPFFEGRLGAFWEAWRRRMTVLDADDHKLGREHYLDSLDELAAGIYKIVGDTRLPEIYMQQENDPQAVEELAYQIGVHVGALIGSTRDHYFGDDGHLGNAVLFEMDEILHVSWVDFESLQRYKDFTPIGRLTGQLEPFYIQRSLAKVRKHFSKSPLDDPSKEFERGFIRGYWRGYRNPDCRTEIPISLLHQAYSIKAA